jgi:hypothetical protein
MSLSFAEVPTISFCDPATEMPLTTTAVANVNQIIAFIGRFPATTEFGASNSESNPKCLRDHHFSLINEDRIVRLAIIFGERLPIPMNFLPDSPMIEHGILSMPVVKQGFSEKSDPALGSRGSFARLRITARSPFHSIAWNNCPRRRPISSSTIDPSFHVARNALVNHSAERSSD